MDGWLDGWGAAQPYWFVSKHRRRGVSTCVGVGVMERTLIYGDGGGKGTLVQQAKQAQHAQHAPHARLKRMAGARGAEGRTESDEAVLQPASCLCLCFMSK